MPKKFFTFDVDAAWAKRHNELIRASRRVQWTSLGLAVAAAVGAGVAGYAGAGARWSVITVVILLLVALAFAVLTVTVPRKMGTPQQFYDRYPLIPAIIAEVHKHDLVLLALVNANPDDTAEPRWALSARTVNGVKGHKRIKGTKVPCVAVSDDPKPGATKMPPVTPMPIAWGTPDQDVLIFARRAIPAAHWALLEKSKRRLPAVLASKNNMLVL